MIIFRELKFSEKEGKPIINNDAAHMTNAGRIGLQAAGGLGILAGIETGRSLYHGSKLYKDINEIKQLKDNPNFRKVAKRIIKDQSKKIPVPGIDNKIIEKIKFAEQNFPKFDKIDKINTAYKWWQRSSKPNRTILNNLGDYTDKGVNEVVSKYGKELGEDGTKLVKRLPKLSSRFGKMGVALKNAKGLGKISATLGSASGLLYLNGRSLESNKDRPITK